MSSLPPGMLLILGSLLGPLLPGRLRSAWFVLLPLLSWLHLGLAIPEGTTTSFAWMQLPLVPIRADRLSLVWGHVFHLAAVLAAIYALYRDDLLSSVMGAMYAGSAIAAVFAGDLLTLFLFWELTAITSAFLVWAGGTSAARTAGMRYLLIQVASGVSLFSGAILTSAIPASCSLAVSTSLAC